MAYGTAPSVIPSRRRLHRLALGGVLVAGLTVGVLGSAGATDEVTLTAGPAAVGATTATTMTSAAPVATPRSTTTALPVSTTIVAPGAMTTTVAPAPMASPQLCASLREHLDGLRRMAVSLTDPKTLRGLVETAGPAAARLSPGAPADARPHLSVLAATIAELRASLDAAGYDVAKLSPDMVTKLQSPLFVGAMSRLDAWADRACA